MHAKLAK